MKPWRTRIEETGGRLVLPSLLVIAALLRLPFLELKALNLDELWGVVQSQGGLRYIFLDEWKIDIHPPLNFVALYYVMKVSQADWFLRLLPALIGVGTVAAIHGLTSRLFDRTTAATAALLVAVSPYAVLYSNYAKCYSLLGLMAIVTTWLVWRGHAEDRPALWGAAAGLNALGLYFHYSVALVIVAQAAFLAVAGAWKRPRPRAWWLGANAGIALAFGPWLPIFLSQLAAARDVALASPLGRELSPPVKLAYFFFSFSLGESVQPWNYPVVALGAVTFGAAFVLGTIHLRRLRGADSLVLLSLWIPILVLLLRPSFQAKHVNIAYPAYAMTLAVGLSQWPGRRFRQLAVLALCGLSVYSVVNYHLGVQLHDSSTAVPWKRIAARLHAEAGPTSRIVMFPPDQLLHYYYRGPSPVVNLRSDVGEHDIVTALCCPSSVRDIWVLLGYPGSSALEAKRAQIRDAVRARCHVQTEERLVPDENLLEGWRAGSLRGIPYEALEIYHCVPRGVGAAESPAAPSRGGGT